MFRKALILSCVCVSGLVYAGSAGAAVTATFSNPTPITINDAMTSGSPRPATPATSTVTVPRLFGAPNSRPLVATVTLLGVSHESPADIDVRLDNPAGGGGATLLDNAGGTTTPVVNANLSFSHDIGSWPMRPLIPFAGPMISGFFAPSSYSEAGVPQYVNDIPFFAAAGAWTISVADDDPGGSGVIAGGFAVSVTYTPSNTLSLTVKVDKKKGTARLNAAVQSAGTLSINKSKSLKSVPPIVVPAAGTYSFTIKATGKALKRLNKKRKLDVSPTVRFAPTGGTVNSATKDFTMKKKAANK